VHRKSDADAVTLNCSMTLASGADLLLGAQGSQDRRPPPPLAACSGRNRVKFCLHKDRKRVSIGGIIFLFLFDKSIRLKVPFFITQCVKIGLFCFCEKDLFLLFIVLNIFFIFKNIL
jgi:hypothetical protein